jgi:hypothetical protein
MLLPFLIIYLISNSLYVGFRDTMGHMKLTHFPFSLLLALCSWQLVQVTE